MTAAQKGSGKVLILVVALLLVLLAIWDLSGPESVLMDLLAPATPDVGDNAREIFDSARPGT